MDGDPLAFAFAESTSAAGEVQCGSFALLRRS
jgi:hypothetical protein